MMKRSAIQLGAAVLLAGLANSPVQAAAATATLQIFGVRDESGLLEFSNHSYLTDASTPHHAGFDAGSSPAAQDFSESSGGWLSLAGAAIDGFGLPRANAGAGGTGEGHGTAAWFFDWTASATGTVNLSVEYLSSVIVDGLGTRDSALAKSFLQVTVEGTATVGEALDFLDNRAGNAGDWRFLTLGFDVAAGETGQITLVAQADALTVPLAPSLWLMGAAVPGFLAGRRRVFAGRPAAEGSGNL